MEVGNRIWNTFHVGNLFQISTDVELITIFYETDLNELWSDRLLAHLIANPSKLKYGQEMLQGDLQRL
jgi:hypothetical protein